MALNKIGTRMIDNPIRPGTSLYNVLINRHTLGIEDFGYIPGKDVHTFISQGVSFLMERGYGTLKVPPVVGVSKYPCSVDIVDIDGEVSTRLTFSNYRYPINNEERPIGGSFQVGDIIENSDVDNNKCMGWTCISAGRPGKWRTTSYLGNWSSEVQVLEYLPDPSVRQVGRLVNVTTSSPSVFVCVPVPGGYKWKSLDCGYGTTAEKPLYNLEPGMSYFNTTIGKLEWYNGSSWEVSVAGSGVGDIGGLTTASKNLAGAVNELDSRIGDLSLLDTIDKTSLVKALNEWGAEKQAFKLASLEKITWFDENIGALTQATDSNKVMIAKKADKTLLSSEITRLENIISTQATTIVDLQKSLNTLELVVTTLKKDFEDSQIVP